MTSSQDVIGRFISHFGLKTVCAGLFFFYINRIFWQDSILISQKCCKIRNELFYTFVSRMNLMPIKWNWLWEHCKCMKSIEKSYVHKDLPFISTNK